MRIYLQVPNQGSEFDSPADKAKLASYQTHSEVTALKTFHERGSTITPALLGYKEDKQADDGLVPSGYITCLVWEKVPGIQLGDNLIPECGTHEFWRLPRAGRDEIPDVFQQESTRNSWSRASCPTLPILKILSWTLPPGNYISLNSHTAMR